MNSFRRNHGVSFHQGSFYATIQRAIQIVNAHLAFNLRILSKLFLHVNRCILDAAIKGL